MKASTKDIQDMAEDIAFITKVYKEKLSEPKERDWKTYEQQLEDRFKTASKELEPLIKEAVDTIDIIKQNSRGRKSKLELETKVKILLLKELLGLSNRQMAYTLSMFSLFTPIDISYKTVERLYSDVLVKMVLHNMHTLILESNIDGDVDLSGDATGYTLTVKEHYATNVQKYKDDSKVSSDTTRYIYSFKLLDLNTNLYIAYGIGFHSEKEAYNRAMTFLEELGHDFKFNSIRLDRYYSTPNTVGDLEKRLGRGVYVYIIPKKNSTARGPPKWQESMGKFVHDTMHYLKEYFRRVQSESAFSQDKRRLGWKIQLKREDRINTADFCKILWHNLFWMAAH